VELLKIGVSIHIFQRHMNLVDVLLEDLGGLVLSSGIEICIVMMEEEGLGALEVFILVVVVFEDELDVVGFSNVGWSSNGARLDFLEDGGDHGETVLGVAFSSEKSVDDGGSDDDLVDGQATILDFQVVDTETGSVKGVPRVMVRAIRSRNAWGADTLGCVLATGMGSVLANLAVMVIFARNGDVFSVTLTDYGFFIGMADGSVCQVNVSKVELQSRGHSPLHVLCPDWDVLVEDDSLDQATFNLDSERLRQWSELREGLLLSLGSMFEVILSIVQSKLDVVKLDIQHTGTSLDVELSSEVNSGCKANIIFRTSHEGSRVTVNVFLSGLEEGCANISLDESGAAEHKAQKNEVLHD
jgi:hypothetical protein